MRAAERGTIDLIEDFAAAIPVQLIGDLLGIPQSERGPLRGWSLEILGALEPVLSTEQFDGGVHAVGDFKDYLRDLVARRASEAHDDRRILSTLIVRATLAGSAAATGCRRPSCCTIASSCSTPATRPRPT